MIKIEINTIEDLIAFVAIIRGEECDLQQIKELVKELNTTTAVLTEAEKKQE